MDLLSGASFQRLEGAVKAATLRQQVLANNIANVDTPNFKRSDVVFEELLSQAMGTGAEQGISGIRTDPRHIPIGASGAIPAAQVVTDGTTAITNSLNNVDIDKEMSTLAANQLRYNLMIQQINHDISMYRIGIKGQ
ncbi:MULTISPECIES: flagellar basal body rod protein FlgB [Cohnella]|uniref:flagellar basal body rod protein FlgB n=1 Tax=Cohnella TaxID=329857 RepID=UPI0009BB06DA|nr:MULTISPECIES: flagellar basal body rod protein FlgB [Cohnella]MBN2983591.1 flagellar basal body rod protein FlgB [Cohnella algarum]